MTAVWCFFSQWDFLVDFSRKVTEVFDCKSFVHINDDRFYGEGVYFYIYLSQQLASYACWAWKHMLLFLCSAGVRSTCWWRYCGFAASGRTARHLHETGWKLSLHWHPATLNVKFMMCEHDCCLVVVSPMAVIKAYTGFTLSGVWGLCEHVVI